ncbi:MAG: recombinase family protein [Firmicutes bacterium]|nr:recombinase family protein [Bacillota bacterium]
MLCDKRFEEDRESAETVRWIFEMYLRGYSCENIAERLNFAKIKSPNEYKKYKGENYKSGFDTGRGIWHYNTVRRILKNEVYCGRLVQGKRKRISYKVKKNVNVEKVMQIRSDIRHRGIIDEEVFEAAGRVLENDNRCSAGRKRVYVLSGVMRCGNCGEKMIRKAVGKYRYYLCGNYRKGSGNECARINEGEIAGAVKFLIEMIASDENRCENNAVKMKIREEKEKVMMSGNEEVKRYAGEIFEGENEEEEELRGKIVINIKKIVIYEKKRCEIYL